MSMKVVPEEISLTNLSFNTFIPRLPSFSHVSSLARSSLIKMF